MSENSRSSLLFTIVFLGWATYLIVKGLTVDGTSKTHDVAAATYLVGGVIIAALALLPRRRHFAPRPSRLLREHRPSNVARLQAGRHSIR